MQGTLHFHRKRQKTQGNSAGMYTSLYEEDLDYILYCSNTVWVILYHAELVCFIGIPVQCFVLLFFGGGNKEFCTKQYTNQTAEGCSIMKTKICKYI